MDGSNFPDWRFDFEPETAVSDVAAAGCLRLLVATVLVGVLVSALVIGLAGPLIDVQVLAGGVFG